MESLTLTSPRALVQEALGLSSGTLAVLTGYREYDQIETVHAAFVAFCEGHGQYTTWQDAWAGFQAQRNVKAPAPSRRPVQQALEFVFQLS